MTEREAFEAWALSAGWPHGAAHASRSNYYSEQSWGAWQAARAQPAQAGALADDELLAMWSGGDERFMRPTLGKSKVLAYGRAVEDAVRAKLGVSVPMTDEQINDAYGAARVQHDHIPHDDVTRIVRAAEKFHGIVGKEGA